MMSCGQTALNWDEVTKRTCCTPTLQMALFTLCILFCIKFYVRSEWNWNCSINSLLKLAQSGVSWYETHNILIYLMYHHNVREHYRVEEILYFFLLHKSQVKILFFDNFRRIIYPSFPVAAEPCGPMAHPLFPLCGHGAPTLGITFFSWHYRGRSCKGTCKCWIKNIEKRGAQKKNVSEAPPPPSRSSTFSGLAHPLSKYFCRRCSFRNIGFH